ncbi:MAG: hemolysin III family protein [Chloroflexi bacterium]|nr:MAG: hemolysin III family protein [Chloroflexota bacterium]
MTASQARPVVGSRYTLGEEIANSITSGIASALSVAALVVMVVHAALRGDGWRVTGCAIFGVSLIVSNLSSTLYHAIALPRAKRVFRVFDHLSIYFLIAAWGWTLCGIVWGLAALGLAIKLTPLHRVRGLSTASYLAMGWTVLIAIKPVLAHVPLGGVWLLLDGGLCYTAGMIFYAWKRLPFSHAIWHLFVLAGNAFHVFAVLYYVIPPQP